MKIKTVIMAGGRGERFWPKSRRQNPKQFASIISDKSMLQETIDRLTGMMPVEDIYVSTGTTYREIVLKSTDIPESNVILEPMGRDTAAAIYLSVASIPEDDDIVYFFIPADHYIGALDKYHKNIKEAAEIAMNEKSIVVIGIPPTEPSTGFGYIHMGEKCDHYHEVQEFVEKPDRDTALEYLSSKDYLWNAGMFLFTRQVIDDIVRDKAAEHYEKIHKYLELNKNDSEAAADVFSTIPRISFDYAVMEKAPLIHCLPAEFTWDDVGSWSAVSRIKCPDENGNCFEGRIHAYNTTGTICQSDDDNRSIILNDVKDMDVIINQDIIYITSKSSEDGIKAILKDLADKDTDII